MQIITDALYWASENIETVLTLGAIIFFALGIAVWQIVKYRARKAGLALIQTETAAPEIEEVKLAFQELPDDPDSPPALFSSGAEAPPPIGMDPLSALAHASPTTASNPAMQQPAPSRMEHPQPAPAAPEPPRYRLRSSEVRAAFQGTVPPVRAGFMYGVASLLVAGMVVVLFLSYFLFVGVIAYGVYYHATQDYQALLGHGMTRAGMLAYLVPLFAGGIMLLFLLKPFIAPKVKTMEPIRLTKEREPLFHCLVEEVCKAVHAPIPREIIIDCNVNAAAGLRRGLWSLFSSSDLLLVVGLPLVTGLSARELAGVLAHEFGHFRQGNAVAINYVLRRINLWFARVVYQRDSWDVALINLSRGGNGYTMVIFMITRMMVGISRCILWVLMMAAHACSCLLSRYQEFDADKYEAYVSGSRSFYSTSVKLMLLSVGQHLAMKDLGEGFKKFVLAEDFGTMPFLRAMCLADETREKIVDELFAEKTGLLSTHPAYQERVTAAEKLAAPGIFTMDRAAKDLFNDYPGLAREASLNFYRAVAGRLIQESSLIPNEVFEKRFGIFSTAKVIGPTQPI